MGQIIAIALGGAAGAVLRFWVAGAVYAWLGRSFPHGTLFVNVSGCFLMGLCSELMLQRFPLAAEYRAAILVGLLGAYTTFSTFALETLTLIEQEGVLKAALNAFLSVVLCLVAVWTGLLLGRKLFVQDLYPWLGHGLPYGKLLLWVVFFGVMAGLAQVFFESREVAAAVRVGFFISWLGLTTVTMTLWLSLRWLGARADWQSLLSLFVADALLAGVAVGAGISIGNSLWNLSKS